ncbi:hypothetical protein [Eisenibacter elegans]|uniref:hypothetical protein n=1 Tax=Eisenibacter elegans TaxID=997 RepID=UPI000405CB48|nr:hypothetical protein [Eisenibacter elegans]
MLPSSVFRSLFILFLMLPWGLAAQLRNEALSDQKPLLAERARELYLRLDALPFVLNTEYFNPITLGRTYFGVQAAPSLVYYPSKRVRLEGGVLLRQDFGADNPTLVSPIFSVKVALTDSLTLTLGMLEGGLTHRLIEPLYAFENLLNLRLEDGMQIQHRSRRWYTDLWVDWQRMIYVDSDFQEIIFAGQHTHYRWLDAPRHQNELVLQGTVLHYGGQIQANKEDPVTNTANVALGWQHTYRPLRSGAWLSQMRLSAYGLSFSGSSFRIQNTPEDEAISGWAAYANASVVSRRNWEFMLSYWYAEGYASAQGGAIYSSFAELSPEQAPQNRQLLFLRLLKEVHINGGVDFLFRLEPYYDFNNQLFEHAAGIYIRYRPDFKLATLKPAK